MRRKVKLKDIKKILTQQDKNSCFLKVSIGDALPKRVKNFLLINPRMKAIELKEWLEGEIL